MGYFKVLGKVTRLKERELQALTLKISPIERNVLWVVKGEVGAYLFRMRRSLCSAQ